MSVELEPHIYQRAFDPEGPDSLAKLARLVRPESRVLDLGAGPGILGRYLAASLGCVMDGVEIVSAAVAQAAPWYRRLECADLEIVDLSQYFPDGQYDFILCADILEHLRQPGRLLAQLIPLLAPQGQLLASVPNAAYAGLIAELLAGEFRYRPEGLLDETHLRFFTISSVTRLLEEHGFRLRAVDTTTLDLRDSEFSQRCLDALPPALVRGLLGRPDALVYQFIIAAMKAEDSPAADQNHDPWYSNSLPELRFASQLFWRAATDSYQESESCFGYGRLGAIRQSVALPIPARPFPLAVLRLDLTDRPGLLHLHAVSLLDQAGRILWVWDGRRESLAEHAVQQMAFAQLHPSQPGATVLLSGIDPILELPIPESALAGLRKGGELRLELSWPMSLDYLVLVQDCIPRRDAEATRIALTDQLRELRSSMAALMEQRRLWELATHNWNAEKAELETALAARAAQQTNLEQQLAADRACNKEMERQAAAQQAELKRQLDTALAREDHQAAELSAARAALSLLRSSRCQRLCNWLRRWRG